jgi:hypothetical protein
MGNDKGKASWVWTDVPAVNDGMNFKAEVDAVIDSKDLF